MLTRESARASVSWAVGRVGRAHRIQEATHQSDGCWSKPRQPELWHEGEQESFNRASASGQAREGRRSTRPHIRRVRRVDGCSGSGRSGTSWAAGRRALHLRDRPRARSTPVDSSSAVDHRPRSASRPHPPPLHRPPLVAHPSRQHSVAPPSPPAVSAGPASSRQPLSRPARDGARSSMNRRASRAKEKASDSRSSIWRSVTPCSGATATPVPRSGRLLFAQTLHRPSPRSIPDGPSSRRRSLGAV